MFQGILDPDGRINNKKSIARLAEVAVAYARAGKSHYLICIGCQGTTIGCHVVAPSDMMDNRVGAIKSALEENGLASKVRE